MMFKKVDLPEPDGPITETMQLFSKLIESPFISIILFLLSL